MEHSQLPDDLARAVEFHGHLCPGLMIGWRAVRAASAFLDLARSRDEELTAVVENNSCSVDAFQALLSTTFGKGNLIWLDHGKQVFTLTDRNRNRAVRVAFTGDRLKVKRPDGSTDREAFMQRLLNAPDQDVVKVEEVPAVPPDKAVIEPSLVCARCGEGVQQSRAQQVGDRILCRPCARREGLS
jgi:formylmethanofuran dehydrogenase subunit E